MNGDFCFDIVLNTSKTGFIRILRYRDFNISFALNMIKYNGQV